MIRYLTAGESHGQGLLGIIEGIPFGLKIKPGLIDQDLARRQKGYGRGERMKIEKDRVTILSGVRNGRATGSPIAVLIKNRDWVNWRKVMAVESRLRSGPEEGMVTRPRPGHGDLAGGLKFGTHDLRDILERASARETVARVALGAVAKQYLGCLNIQVVSYVVELGGVKAKGAERRGQEVLERFHRAEKSELRTFDELAEKRMKARIDEAKRKGETLGGIFELVALGVPPGLGSHIQWDRRLDAKLAAAVMSIPAIKGLEVGLGFAAAARYGSQVHDPIQYDRQGPWPFRRERNNAGGLEAGMSNGEPIVIRAAMKPIATLKNALPSVDVRSKEAFSAHVERGDICALPAAAVVGEAMMALEIACAASEKFGGDSLAEVERNYNGYLESLRSY